MPRPENIPGAKNKGLSICHAYKKVRNIFIPFIRYGRNFEMVATEINLDRVMNFGTELQLIAEEYPFGPLQPYATGINLYNGELTL